MGEHLPCKQGVAGSNPTISTTLVSEERGSNPDQMEIESPDVGFEKEWCGEAAFGQSGGLFENDVGKALHLPAGRYGENHSGYSAGTDV